jgi:predicted RND superfamily exporter protein
MYNHVGAGVSTGAMTTAVVFFSLLAVGFEGFEKMSKAMGAGILVTLFCMTVLLPVLIAWDHKGYSVVGNFLRKIKCGFVIVIWTSFWKGFFWIFKLPVFTWLSSLLQFTWLETIGRIASLKPAAALLLLASLVLGGLSLYGGMNIKFEYDMAKQAPQNTESIKTQNVILDKFEFSPDYAMLKADDVQDCRTKVKKFKKMGNRTGLIGQVDAITEFMPLAEEQQDNIPLIEEFKSRLAATSIPKSITPEQVAGLGKELDRLHSNIVEIGELSIMGSGEENKIIRKCDQIVGKENEQSYVLKLAQLVKDLSDSPAVLAGYQKIMAKILKNKLMDMTSTEIITLDKLPRDIRNRYVNPKNDDLLVSIYPKGYIWDELKLRKFFEKATAIDPGVTGMPAIMIVYIDLMKDKGLYACLFGAIAILLFLLIDFRSFTFTILSMVPLAFGALWMVGLMALLGMKFSISNFMALPLILGIGIDDGVHVLHRYRIEGRGSVPMVIKYTGRAILLTSLTTMIGFGSMGLASHKGIAALGQVLFLGVGTCFLSSVIVLPALITLFERFIRVKGDGQKKQED